ncbi:hypothetical protein SSPIM334S_07589 [Streptomyces spiroverticillatus]
MPGVLGQARVEDLGDLGVGGQHVGDARRVLAVPVHAYGEGLDPAQHQPGVEGTGDGTHRVLMEHQLLGDSGVVGDERTPDDVRVPAHVLGGRVHDDVRAQRDRLLEVGAGEGVVDDELRARRVRDLRDGGDVRDPEQRVGGRLDPHDLRTGRERGPDRRRVGGVGDRPLHAPARDDLGEEPEGAAVRVVRDDDVVAGRQERTQQAVLGSQPRSEGEPAPAALQGGEVLLQGGAGRVGAAAVLVTAAQAPDPVLLVRRHLVDRRNDGAGQGVGGVARVDGEGLEGALGAALLISHGAEGSSPTGR